MSSTIDIKIITAEDKTPIKALIILRAWSQDSEGNILISPECATYTEIEHWVDVRISELERVKREAMRAFSK